MVHVRLDELERLILDHPDRFVIKLFAEFSQLFPREALSVLCRIESSRKDRLNIVESTDGSTHAQTEVTKPLVIKCDGPVLTQELHDVGNNSSLVPTAQRVKVVLMEADERPQRLKDDFFASHVGY